MEKTPLSDVWGVGGRLAAKFQAMGLSSAKDLRDLDPAWIGLKMGVTVERTVHELKGVQRIAGDLAPANRQTLVSSRSFGRAIRELEDLAEALSHHCAVAGERLRAEGLLAGGLSIFIGTGHFDERPFHTGATLALPRATSHTGELIAAARAGL